MPDFEQIQKDPESMENFINQKRLSTLITAIKKISKEMEKIESLRDSVELYFLASVKESFISYVNDMYLSVQKISEPPADIKEFLLQHVDDAYDNLLKEQSIYNDYLLYLIKDVYQEIKQNREPVIKYDDEHLTEMEIETVEVYQIKEEVEFEPVTRGKLLIRKSGEVKTENLHLTSGYDSDLSSISGEFKLDDDNNHDSTKTKAFMEIEDKCDNKHEIAKSQSNNLLEILDEKKIDLHHKASIEDVNTKLQAHESGNIGVEPAEVATSDDVVAKQQVTLDTENRCSVEGSNNGIENISEEICVSGTFEEVIKAETDNGKTAEEVEEMSSSEILHIENMASEEEVKGESETVEESNAANGMEFTECIASIFELDSAGKCNTEDKSSGNKQDVAPSNEEVIEFKHRIDYDAETKTENEESIVNTLEVASSCGVADYKSPKDLKSDKAGKPTDIVHEPKQLEETYSATADEEDKQKKECSIDVEIEPKDSLEDQDICKAEVKVKNANNAVESEEITDSDEEVENVLEGKDNEEIVKETQELSSRTETETEDKYLKSSRTENEESIVNSLEVASCHGVVDDNSPKDLESDRAGKNNDIVDEPKQFKETYSATAYEEEKQKERI